MTSIAAHQHLTQNELSAITALKKEIAQHYALQWIKLIGSKARGDSDSESDLDVVIVLKDLTWPLEKSIYELCYALSVQYDVLISPVLFSSREISDRFIQITPFYKAVQQEGMLL